VKVVRVSPYRGPVGADGLVDVYDLTVADTHLYTLACGVVVSNSKRLALLDVNALLAHGATETLRDAGLYRGQRNDTMWLQFLSGHAPDTPRVPFVYEKFLEQLRAAGVNVVRSGPRLRLMALTAKDVDLLAGDREIENAGTVLFDKGLRPVRGGLFDERLTGGHGGRRWSFVRLPEPYPNPVMEEPIRRLLGLTATQFEEVLAGRRELPGHGTGPRALAAALDAVDLDRELAKARADYRSGKASARDAAVRRWGYLDAAKKLGLHPREWVLDKVPVLPPAFRPVGMLGDSGVPLVSDPNYLYKELIEARDAYNDLRRRLPEDELGDERLAVYRAFKAVAGLGDPVHPRLRNKNVKGILRSVFGDSPKFGCYDDRTEILTEHGWRPFAGLAVGTRVAALDPQTGAFVWQAVEGVYAWDYCGEMFGLRNRRLDCLVTPAHRHWVGRRAGWDFEPAYVTAAAAGTRRFRTAAGAWHGHDGRPGFLPDACRAVDFAAFVGLWLAAGVAADPAAGVVRLFCPARPPARAEAAGRLVRALGLPCDDGPARSGRRAGRCWTVRSAELAAWLAGHAGLSSGRRLSDAVRGWSAACLAALLDAYQAAAGRRPSVSAALADDLQEIACKAGRTAVCDADADGVRLTVVAADTVGVRGRSDRVVVPYSGRVYCVAVPSGVVYVRRHGRPFFSGNTVQRKLISSTVDNVGRAVITPNPDLDMDSVGLPEDLAFDVYQKAVVRRLRRAGMPVRQAVQHVRERTPLARDALLKEMEVRPVFINRAPVLHKFGILAFRPRLTAGDTLQVSPLVVGGFNADFDGDAMQFHVPLTDEAVREAYERLLPSRSLLSPADFRTPVHKPGQQYLAGLYHATRPVRGGGRRRPPRVFRNAKDVLAAFARGDVTADTEVHVLEDR